MARRLTMSGRLLVVIVIAVFVIAIGNRLYTYFKAAAFDPAKMRSGDCKVVLHAQLPYYDLDSTFEITPLSFQSEYSRVCKK